MCSPGPLVGCSVRKSSRTGGDERKGIVTGGVPSPANAMLQQRLTSTPKRKDIPISPDTKPLRTPLTTLVFFVALGKIHHKQGMPKQEVVLVLETEQDQHRIGIRYAQEEIVYKRQQTRTTSFGAD